MCGIAGIIGCAEQDRVERMTQIMAHRGPNSSGVQIFADDGVALGHRRLSILDLSERGHQPMADPKEQCWITFNGEIYNYRELRQELETAGFAFRSDTDTEVLLYAYQHWGVACLQKLDGMFAFAIWDRPRQTLFAARDRLGIKPFYYHQGDARLVFASEIKALFASGLVPKAIDYVALHTPALYQASPLTGFQDVSKLPPAHYLTYASGKLSLQSYWQIVPREEQPPLNDAIGHLDELIQKAVAQQMVADVPVGAFLSGGLDSSLLVALMGQHSRQPVTTFTIRYSDADQRFEKMADDSFYARKVAELFGCLHHELTIHPDVADLLPKMVWHLDEPLSDPAAINTYLISKAARDQGILVLLNGMGGDEICGGYRSQLACLLAQKYRAFLPGVARHLIESAVNRLPTATAKGGLRLARWAQRFVSMASQPGEERYALIGMMDAEKYRSLFSWQHIAQQELSQHHHIRNLGSRLNREGLSYLTRMCLADTEVYLPDHNLNYSDKCTMAASVEGRPPLTDHRIVEFMFSLAPDFRIRRLTQKFLLKKVAEKYLPREIIYRPKAPFGAPLRAWIRGGLSEMIGDLLSVESLNRRGIYDSKFIWQLIENDRAGREDNSHLIWRFLCNELWLRAFFS